MSTALGLALGLPFSTGGGGGGAPPATNRILWDDGDTMAWDDGDLIAWDN